MKKMRVTMRFLIMAAIMWMVTGALRPCLAAQSGLSSNQPDCGYFAGIDPWVTPPYSPTRLIGVHDCLLGHYDPNAQFDFHTLQSLERAGVKTLLTGPGGVSPHQRIQILNDYGFWLSKQGWTNAEAASVLKVVVQLAPDRAIAWLNLGDIYHAMLTEMSIPNVLDGNIKAENATWGGKVKITTEALDAYRHYLELSSSPSQRVKDFVSLNILNAPTSNACQFVAAFANAGREREIFSDQIDDDEPVPVNLLGDGVKYYVYIRTEGTMDFRSIYATTTPVSSSEYPSEIESGVDFDPLNSPSAVGGGNPNDNPGDELHLFAIKNHYYVIHDAFSSDNNGSSGISHYPLEVIAPNNGVICNITTKIQPKLDSNRNPLLCNKLLHGFHFKKIDFEPSSDDDQIESANEQLHLWDESSPFEPWDPNLTGLAVVDLQNNGHKETIASLEESSSAGPGCDANEIGLFDPKANELIHNDLNSQILQIPGDCKGSSTYLIDVDSKVYIESDHGRNLDPGEAEGMGIYEVKNDQLNDVCLIQNSTTFVAD